MRKTFICFALLFAVGCSTPKPQVVMNTQGQLLTAVGPYTNSQGLKVVRFIWAEKIVLYSEATAVDPNENVSFLERGQFREVEVYPAEKVPAEILGKPLWVNVIIKYKVVNTDIPIIYLLDFKQNK